MIFMILCRSNRPNYFLRLFSYFIIFAVTSWKAVMLKFVYRLAKEMIYGCFKEIG